MFIMMIIIKIRMRYQSKWSVLHSRYDIVIATNEFFFRYFSRARMIRPLSLANIRRIICWIGGGNSFNSSVKMIFFLSSSLPLWGNKTAGSAFLWNHQIAIISANYLNCQLNSTPRYKVIHFFRYFFSDSDNTADWTICFTFQNSKKNTSIYIHVFFTYSELG